jgi:hypothetical protein
METVWRINALKKPVSDGMKKTFKTFGNIGKPTGVPMSGDMSAYTGGLTV